MVVVTSDKHEEILSAVRMMYTDVALKPEREFHFPTGRAACELVGYPTAVLDSLPPEALESFAGVGYPFAADVIREGDRVLDVGAGAGTDTFLASGLVGPRGQVLALDMTSAMRDKLRRIAESRGIGNIESIDGNAEEIPLPDASVSIVTSNGVLNLVPDKQAAISEIARVLVPGGRIQIADIVLGKAAGDACVSQPQLWAECVVGATTQDDYLRIFRSAGFGDLEVIDTFDYFSAAAPGTRKVAQGLGARAIVLRATKAA